MSIQDATRDGQRIAKVMARAGLCSRRDAERWIEEGRVVVNGEILTSPAYNVSEADDVRVDGEPLRARERTRLFCFHKPKGLVTTAHDPEGRPTIFDALPPDLPRVVTIGRLDINTEGLLLLTNDGGLARVLELPATGWLRRYRVRAHGEISQDQLDALRDGVSIDGVDYRGIEAKFERQQGSNVWLTMGLREGKNREIKRVLEHLGLSVNRLIRVSFGPFELADLPERAVAEVRSRVLRDQLGPKLAKQANVDFDGASEVAAPPEPQERPRGPSDASQAPPRKRKHVSVLRAEAREDAAGQRKRTTRTATADRKGREVQVERISLARPAAEPPRRAPGGRGAPGERPRRAPGEGRSFAGARSGGDRAERHSRAGDEHRPERPFEGVRGARAVGDRPERRPRSEKPARSGGATRFAEDRRRPRTEGPPQNRPARFGAGKTPRGSSGETRGPASRAGSERAERRPYGDGPPRERPARSGDGPSRNRGGFDPRPTGERPERRPRTEGAPREGRAFAPRSAGERPERRPRGDGPPRGPRPGGGAERAERRPHGDGPARERPARSTDASSGARGGFGPRSTGERPERRPRGDGPPRGPRPGGGGPRNPGGPRRPPRD